MMNEKWTPQLVGKSNRYYTFALQAHECSICHSDCMTNAEISYHQDMFPKWSENTQKAQMKRAGIRKARYVYATQGYVCDKCSEQGLVTVKCELCGENRSLDNIETQYGDPADFLCKFCYETVPAKTWADKCESLRDAHQWDYT